MEWPIANAKKGTEMRSVNGETVKVLLNVDGSSLPNRQNLDRYYVDSHQN